MRLELIDLIFRTESRFAIRIEVKDLVGLLTRRHPPDASVGEFCAMVRAKLKMPPRGDEPFGPAEHCSACGYCLNMLRFDGRCPECGSDLLMEGGVEAGVRRDLCRLRGVKPANVRPDKLLIADLGLG